MSVQLTEAEFSKHVNTKFRVAVEPPVELELIQVKGYLSKANEVRPLSVGCRSTAECDVDSGISHCRLVT